jgi:hypothetical protein
MNVLLAFLILLAPFALAVVATWAFHRHDAMRTSLLSEFDDPDYYRVEHDALATRTRFERSPAWPASGAMGERR